MYTHITNTTMLCYMLQVTYALYDIHVLLCVAYSINRLSWKGISIYNKPSMLLYKIVCYIVYMHIHLSYIRHTVYV